MLELTDHLSVWELAHRWHVQDPNTSNPTELPLPVQDTIRFLCKGLVDCEISVCNANGIELKKPNNVLSYDDYLDQYPPCTNEDIEETTSTVVPAPETSESHWDELMQKAEEVDALSPPIEEPNLTDDPDGYETYLYRYGRRHWALVDGLDKSYKLRVYDKQALDTAHINQPNLLKLCEIYGVRPPKFWFTQEELDQYDEGGHKATEKGSRTIPEIDAFWDSLKHKQKARIMTREIASILWKEDPSRTIVAMEQHEAIRIYGMAANYGGINTVRNWIKELKPLNKKTTQIKFNVFHSPE